MAGFGTKAHLLFSAAASPSVCLVHLRILPFGLFSAAASHWILPFNFSHFFLWLFPLFFFPISIDQFFHLLHGQIRWKLKSRPSPLLFLLLSLSRYCCLPPTACRHLCFEPQPDDEEIEEPIGLFLQPAVTFILEWSSKTSDGLRRNCWYGSLYPHFSLKLVFVAEKWNNKAWEKTATTMWTTFGNCSFVWFRKRLCNSRS